MNFFATLLAILFAVFSVVLSAPVAPRDVFSPRILYPNSSTVWKAGSTHTVKWDTSNAPQHITNNEGVIMLKNLDNKLEVATPWAMNFPIMSGEQQVHVPAHTTPGNTYKLVLMGDSGNESMPFKIEAA